MTIQQKRLLLLITAPASILLTPLIAMQFSDQVNWGVFDFIVGGILLFGSSFLIDLVIRKTREKKFRIFLFISIILALVLVWAELAVGIFGTPLAGS